MNEVVRPLRVLLANPRGFCAGVERAIAIVERALEIHGPPVYVRHEIVHNKHVVDGLRARGAVFVSEVDEVPEGAVTVFSAHGVSQKVENEATARDLDVIDATCPLVRKVHKEGRRYSSHGYDIILIGHRGHAEVEGTSGQIPGRLQIVSSSDDVAQLYVADPDKVAYVTQTTLSVRDTKAIIEALRAKYPKIVGPDTRDICYATQNRQEAVLKLIERVDVLFVVGAANSSNSNRLREIGEEAGIPSYLIETPEQLDPRWIAEAGSVGLTAGASAPEILVRRTIDRLASIRPTTVRDLNGVEENIHFRLPARLAAEPA